MTNYIDYIYYRICKLYFKYDGKKGIHASLIISLTQGMLLFDLMLFLEHFLFTPQQLRSSKIIEYVVVAISVVPAFVYNYINYLRSENKFNDLNNIWENESKSNKVIKGFFIFLFLLLPWIILYFINLYLQKAQVA
jgi:hypothetical protein